MPTSQYPQALTIAGSDSGGGAGIQADLKTFQMRHVFGTSVLTAVTAQNTLGVFDIHTIPLSMIEHQLKAIAEDFNIQAFKIGMLGNEDIIRCVAENIERYDFGQLVLDPVMIAKGGSPLLQQSAVDSLIKFLLPHATIITPNLPEAEALTGIHIHNKHAVEQAARTLQKMGAKTIVIKGGHSEDSQSEYCIDYVFTPTEQFTLKSKRYHTPHTHGTGCTFSACIAAELAKGKEMSQALTTAKAFISAAISHPLNIGNGHGPTNHWAYKDEANNLDY